MNSTVCRPVWLELGAWPASMTARTSLTPALSADSCTKRRLVALDDDQGERGLAGAGRPEQDQRHRRVALDQPAQRRARAEQVLLADDLVQGARPHPGGQRRVGSTGAGPGEALRLEQVISEAPDLRVARAGRGR